MKYLLTILTCFTLKLPSAGFFISSISSDTVRNYEWYKPTYIPVQFAGDMGLISTGLGYTLANGRFQLGLLYGYVPKSVGKSRIHLISMKGSVQLFEFSIYRYSILPYAGLAPVLEVGGNSFIRLPSKYPPGYYHPNSLHIHLFTGLKVRMKLSRAFFIIKGADLFLATGTVDVFLWYKITEREVKLNRIFSAAFGVNLLLN